MPSTGETFWKPISSAVDAIDEAGETKVVGFSPAGEGVDMLLAVSGNIVIGAGGTCSPDRHADRSITLPKIITLTLQAFTDNSILALLSISGCHIQISISSPITPTTSKRIQLLLITIYTMTMVVTLLFSLGYLVTKSIPLY